MQWYDILKNLRETSGESMSKAAEEIGIPKGTYASYEYGKREPNIEMITKIANHYKVTTDYLLGRPGALPPADPLAKLELSAMELYMLRSYLALDPDKRRNFFDGVVLSVNRGDSTQEADSAQQDTAAQTLSMAARGGDDHSGKQTIPGGINTLLDSPSTDDDL